MHQGRLQIRSSLVASASLDTSVVYLAITATLSSRPTTAANHHPIGLDLEREVLAEMLSVACRLGHVLDVQRHGYPAVHSFLVDREGGTRKLRVCERADRNRDEAFKASGCVVHR